MTLTLDTAMTVDDELVRRQVDAVLRRVGVAGVIPTPLEAIAASIGIGEVLDIGEFNAQRLANHRRIRRPGATFRRLIGLLLYEPRIVLVDMTQLDGPRRWTEAHELAHKLLPWHERNRFLDDDVTLSQLARDVVEREANVGAAELLFQGRPFWDRCLQLRPGIGAAIAMSEVFNTSITATIRYYVETHPGEVAVACVGQSVRNKSRHVIYTVESQRFRERFGAVDTHLPARSVPTHGIGPYADLSGAVRAARSERTVCAGELGVVDLSGASVILEVESFYNGYNSFVLFSPRKRLKLGRRIEVVSQMPR